MNYGCIQIIRFQRVLGTSDIKLKRQGLSQKFMSELIPLNVKNKVAAKTGHLHKLFNYISLLLIIIHIYANQTAASLCSSQRMCCLVHVPLSCYKPDMIWKNGYFRNRTNGYTIENNRLHFIESIQVVQGNISYSPLISTELIHASNRRSLHGI